MIDRQALLKDLQGLLRSLEADLLERSESAEVPEVPAALKEEYEKAKKAERTALNYEDWRSDYITQIAAAWVLSCVFARFLEDNQLVDPPKLAGPGDRLNRARDEHTMFFQDRERATQTDREYLLHVFETLAKLPGAKEIFGQHNPVWQLPNWLSGDAAGELLRFFQRIDADTGTLVHDFTDPQWDTRFLGDLYQDLSEAARKKYALLQTPEFVEEFILDRTLEPALDEFGLVVSGQSSVVSTGERGLQAAENCQLTTDNYFRMIDPACGSGHFLLGAFRRIFDRWCREDPGAKCRVVAQRTLDSIYGVDLNPFAVAIARFRLLLAALKACGVLRLSKAPAFELNLACGDSLYHGRERQMMLEGVETDESHYFHTEDAPALRRMLREGTYHCVVANPPYITPKDRAANNAYRRLYTSCHMKYSLSVPFMERIFRLAVQSGENGKPAGYTGQITANSFMKREFGKKLIEEFLPTVDLTHVIDTSGAYIPGHGTPTVILFARNRKPLGDTIRTVMGIRGEPSTPDDAAEGLVWTAIVEQVDHAGSQSEFVSVGDSSRELFGKHPWSIGGGGAAELKNRLEDAANGQLGEVVDEIGVLGMTNADEVMLAPSAAFRRRRVESHAFRRVALGDEVRDWHISDGDAAVFPYTHDSLINIGELPGLERWLWRTRTVLGNRATFARLTYFREDRPWWEWHQIALRRLERPLSIVYGEVATHNHFVLDRGGKVFNRTAPVIKLPPGTSEDEHLALLGLLNSSTACFWMKQVCHNKGDSTDNKGARTTGDVAFNTYAYNSTLVGKLPLPADHPLALARQLDALAQEVATVAPQCVLTRRREGAKGESAATSLCGLAPLREALSAARGRYETLRRQMIALQEELDWACYRLYGLIDEDFARNNVAQPPSAVPNRAKPFRPEYRRNLPHLITDERPLFVTFRTFRHWILPENARQLVLRHCLFDHGRKMHLHAAVVMPDHVHLVLSLGHDGEGRPFGLPEIMNGIKGASAHSVNKLLGRKGHVWQDESHDHVLRDEESLEDTVNYVCQNPVRKGLVARCGDYCYLWWEGKGWHDEVQLAPLAQPRVAVPQGGALELGQRAFEIVLARKMARGEAETTWFTRHRITPITGLPDDWPDEYRRLVERRIELIEKDRNIGLIEQPQYKRRWNTQPWESQLERALREWLLERLESYFDFDGRMTGQQSAVSKREEADSRRLIAESSTTTVARLADVAGRDPEFMEVGEVYRDDKAFDVQRLVEELVTAESVPLLPVLRYKPAGLRKRVEWEKTWELQREEDKRSAVSDQRSAGEDKLTADELTADSFSIPVPPKYKSSDFQKSNYWRLRGKLDVPKERWTSFPHCEGEDGTLVIAWAGYDHLQLARAISAYYVDVQERLGGRDDPRLVPLLACLIELLPWLKQWHNEVDPEFGMAMGDYFEGFIQEEARQMGKTVAEVKAWEPPQRAGGRRRRQT